MKSFASMATAVALAGLIAVPATAQTGAEFYDGRTVEYIVATDAGGNYDTYGRLLSEFMQRHLPGSTFVVRNMPGAGHIIGANYIYAAEPDGLTIGTFNTGLIYSQLAGVQGIQFDLGDMSWIGKASSDPRMIVVSAESDIETFEDLRSAEGELLFASGGVGSAAYIETVLLANALELPVRVVSGYDGNADALAIQRGEVQGSVGSRTAYQQFVNDGFGRFVAQIGGSNPDVPQLSDLVESEEGRRAVALIESQGTISRLTAGPAGIPEDRLEALRDAYEAAVNDPEFLERVEQLQLPLDPLFGDEVAQAVAEALDQDQAMVDFLVQMLDTD